MRAPTAPTAIRITPMAPRLSPLAVVVTPHLRIAPIAKITMLVPSPITPPWDDPQLGEKYPFRPRNNPSAKAPLGATASAPIGSALSRDAEADRRLLVDGRDFGCREQRTDERETHLLIVGYAARDLVEYFRRLVRDRTEPVGRVRHLVDEIVAVLRNRETYRLLDDRRAFERARAGFGDRDLQIEHRIFWASQLSRDRSREHTRRWNELRIRIEFEDVTFHFRHDPTLPPAF